MWSVTVIASFKVPVARCIWNVFSFFWAGMAGSSSFPARLRASPSCHARGIVPMNRADLTDAPTRPRRVQRATAPCWSRERFIQMDDSGMATGQRDLRTWPVLPAFMVLADTMKPCSGSDPNLGEAALNEGQFIRIPIAVQVFVENLNVDQRNAESPRHEPGAFCRR